MSFHCGKCGKDHEGLPDVGMEYPDPYLAIPKDEREERTEHTEDTCIVHDDDATHYFVRAVIMLPLHDRNEPFGIGVWVSQSEKNFNRYVEGESMEPTVGYLVNTIVGYEETTFLLVARLHFQKNGRRPLAELEPTEHRLAVEQRNGISMDRAWEIVHYAVED